MKKALNFDLDTKKLKQYYPEKDWHRGYDEIRKFLEGKGFEHIQGSGYHSKGDLSSYQAVSVIYEMSSRYEWINFCVKSCEISNIPLSHDVTHIFDKAADKIMEKQAIVNEYRKNGFKENERLINAMKTVRHELGSDVSLGDIAGMSKREPVGNRELDEAVKYIADECRKQEIAVRNGLSPEL